MVLNLMLFQTELGKPFRIMLCKKYLVICPWVRTQNKITLNVGFHDLTEEHCYVEKIKWSYIYVCMWVCLYVCVCMCVCVCVCIYINIYVTISSFQRYNISQKNHINILNQYRICAQLYIYIYIYIYIKHY